MNAALLISACALTLQSGLGTLMVGLARTPGWRIARVTALIAFSAAAYSVGNLLTLVDPGAGLTREIGSRLKYFAAALHVCGWLVYAFARGEPRWRELPAPIRTLVVAIALLGGACLATGGHADTTHMWTVRVPWAGVEYRLADSTPLGLTTSYLDVAGLLVAFAALVVRARKGGQRWVGQLVAFAIFFACAIDEMLVANGAIHFLMLAEVGFSAVLVPLAVETVRRFTESTAELSWRSSALTGEIAIRTRERDQAQDALLESERHASLGRLAAGVAHQINNPLSYLQLNLELIREWGREQGEPDELRESIDAALDGTTRIRRVVDALRAYTRTAAGTRRPLPPAEFVQSALRLCEHHLRPVARVEPEFGVTPNILGDEPSLVQLVVNLLINAADALKASPAPEGGRIVVRTSTLDGGEACIEVIDNGPGIDAAHLPKIMEPYFTTHRSGDHMGLGLFLARATVEQHGGRIEFDRVLPRGTRARVILAAAPSVLEQIAAQPPGASAPHTGLQSAGWSDAA